MSSPYPSSGLFNESSQVPNSCIESAEYIIQATATAKIPAKWTSGAATKPHVWAVFHSHMVNISNTPNFHNLVDSSVKEYPFAGTLPGLGEGLCIVNTIININTREIFTNCANNCYCACYRCCHHLKV